MAIPNATKVKILDSSIDLVNDTIKVALYNDTVAYTQDIDNHDFVADVLDSGTTAEEFGGSGGTGYSRKTLSGKQVDVDDTDDEAEFSANDLSWSGLDGETIQGIIIYRQVGGDDTSPGDDEIIQIIDDADTGDLPLTTNGGAVDLSWAAEGIVNLA